MVPLNSRVGLILAHVRFRCRFVVGAHRMVSVIVERPGDPVVEIRLAVYREAILVDLPGRDGQFARV